VCAALLFLAQKFDLVLGAELAPVDVRPFLVEFVVVLPVELQLLIVGLPR
jgi:hypothetical protein